MGGVGPGFACSLLVGFCSRSCVHELGQIFVHHVGRVQCPASQRVQGRVMALQPQHVSTCVCVLRRSLGPHVPALLYIAAVCCRALVNCALSFCCGPDCHASVLGQYMLAGGVGQ